MKLSVVATLYQSAPYIEEFCRRVAEAARSIAGEDFEIVLVNDGSPDQSLEVALALQQISSKIVIVDLSRNFGHHKAMMTGLAYAKGRHIFLIDSDLEEEPEWLKTFWSRLHEEQCDVVYGVQDQRKGKWFERKSGELFYRVFSALTGLSLPRNIVTARLMTRRYVDALLCHEERELMIAGLWHITGFDQRSHIVKKQSSSETTYTIRKKIAVLTDSVTSFSNLPLVGIFYVGLTIFSFASLYTLYLIAHRLFVGTTLSGWTSVMASIWLLGGLIISFIGVIGIYLAKVFSESKRRPYTIVRQVYGRQD